MPSQVLEARKKNLQALSKEKFDVLIIGAGITGAATAWDAALRGLKVAIIDKEDYGAGTSSGSSKLVHAGIRYLAYGEFSLVRHASRERQWMFKYIPHITSPIPFLIPNYKKGKNSFVKLIFAGVLYDLLSFFKNTKTHKFLSKKKTLEKIPNLKSDPLKRSLFYYDGMMDDARVNLEVILSAREQGAICVNHLEAEEFEIKKGPDGANPIESVTAVDKLTGEKVRIEAKTIVNATGPWTDGVLAKVNHDKKLLRTTKGIHIITKRIVEDDSVVVITADDERGMFVIPFRKNYSLIGTTDTFFDTDFDHVEITQEDIDYAVSAVNNDFPGSITNKDVISAYSGIRPLLISPKAKSETDTSRWYDIIETNPGFFTITGGKYTIFRYMAEKMVDRLVKQLQLKKSQYKCQTKTSYVHGGERIANIEKYVADSVSKIVNKYKLEIDSAEHIANTYGTCHEELLSLADEDKKLLERIAPGRPHIVAEIHYAVKKEMCLSLSDFLLRRTQLQLLEHQGLDCAEKIAKIMSKLLDWDDKEIKKQFTNYKKDLCWNP
ncbi:MAG: FAD-dependent oxidoreductase [Candidatus Heimdallarchaeota archaeon]